jgi:hypothetical protein
MNRIALAGRIVIGPTFHKDQVTQAAVFTLCCGGDRDVVTVAAIRNSAIELNEFQNGQTVSVEGRVIWRDGTLEILAESIRKWTNSKYDPEALAPKRAEWHRVRPVKLCKAPKRHW